MKIAQKLFFSIAMLNYSQVLAAGYEIKGTLEGQESKLINNDPIGHLVDNYFAESKPAEAKSPRAKSPRAKSPKIVDKPSKFKMIGMSSLYNAATGMLWSQNKNQPTKVNVDAGNALGEELNVLSVSSFEEINMPLAQNNKTLLASEKNSEFVILSDAPQSQGSRAESFVHVGYDLNSTINNSKNQINLSKEHQASKMSDDFMIIDSQKKDSDDSYDQKQLQLSINMAQERINSKQNIEDNFGESNNVDGMIFHSNHRLSMNNEQKYGSFVNNTQDEFHLISSDSQDEFNASAGDTREEFSIISSLDAEQKISTNSKDIHQEIDLLFSSLRENLKASFQENAKLGLVNPDKGDLLESLQDQNLLSMSLSKESVVDGLSDSQPEYLDHPLQTDRDLISLGSDDIMGSSDISQRFQALGDQIIANNDQDTSYNSQVGQGDLFAENLKNSYKESVASFFKNAQIEMDSLFEKIKNQISVQEVLPEEISETSSNNASILGSRSSKNSEALDSFLKDLRQEVSVYINNDDFLENDGLSQLAGSSESVMLKGDNSKSVNALRRLDSLLQSIQEKVSNSSDQVSEEEVAALIDGLRNGAELLSSSSVSDDLQRSALDQDQAQSQGANNVTLQQVLLPFEAQAVVSESSAVAKDVAAKDVAAKGTADKQTAAKGVASLAREIATSLSASSAFQGPQTHRLNLASKVQEDVELDDKKHLLGQSAKMLSHNAINQASLSAKSINNTMLKRIYHSVINGSGAGGDVAVAAGQELERPYTLWGSGFGGFHAEQNGFNSKTNLAGGAIGLEFPFSDSRILGLAFNNINFDTKYNLDDKVVSKNYLISAYNINKINNFIINGALFLGYGDVNAARATGGAGVAKANWHQAIYGAHGILAYDFQKSAHVITPSVALHYSYTSQSRYSETGAKEQNHVVNKKNAQVFSSSAAVKYSYSSAIGQLKVTPGLQLSVSRELMTKASDAISKIQGSDGYVKIATNAKERTLFGIAPSLTAKINNTDVQLVCSWEKGRKSRGHTVALKVSSVF